ncbi:epoxide hydrolase family protein [Janthinobacterium agaricidamnosum]|uniref:Epoxide hydrolase N terminus family protein n=1 Tax=Janthinobacterium agaricidamnosum NBRC 102515 = DSM 9628 TaxID=1349767 RepID=W0VEC6_9BURK|nr:epoxide hydrolase [Janthinobacterium agaricidamnosum]CDG85768.1 epoxide hydrolase N terminus family protein [Janthinobacterium agaricidamnosum NBRC 102515 = DSM 9628]
MSHHCSIDSAPGMPAYHPDSGQRRLLMKTGAAAAVGYALGVLPAAYAAAQAANPLLRPYQVVWPAEQIASLKKKITAYRFPQEALGAGWKYGCDTRFLRELCDYWVDGFDMAAAVDNLNRFPQFTTEVEDFTLHVVRVIGEDRGAKPRRPLLLTHGWPGSTFEFWQAIEALAFPSRFGGKPEDAFDLIIPSLPGFGPSSKPAAPIGARTTARLFDKLMRENLGYQRYFAQGGDWGAGVTGWLGIDHPQSLRAMHLNLMIAATQLSATNDAERKFYQDGAEHEARLGGYYHLQATHPQSLAYGMVDHPVGQAAWLIERFYAWSDKRTRPFEQVFSKDQLLTNVMIYIMNDAFQTSTWFYTGCHEEGVTRIPAGKRVQVPTGYAVYSGDARSPNPPRSLSERLLLAAHQQRGPGVRRKRGGPRDDDQRSPRC